jgi:hypothetical protein
MNLASPDDAALLYIAKLGRIQISSNMHSIYAIPASFDAVEESARDEDEAGS